MAVPSSAAVAADAAAVAARVSQLQQLLAQTAGGLSGNAATTALSGGTLAPTTATSGSGQDFATLLASTSATSPAASAPSGYGAYSSLITQAAARYGIDPALLYGVISQESAFNPDAVSSAGAEGLAQIMPENFASLGVTNPFNPAQSIDAGAKLLSENLNTFNGNTVDAVAAYNAGAGAVQSYGGVPPYPETQNYVQKVLAYAAQYPGAAPASATAPVTSTATLL